MKEMPVRPFVLLALLIPVFSAGCASTPAAPGAAGRSAVPWTAKPFAGSPDDFSFAVMADRTGGMRPGVFDSAVEKVNLMRPEFVICVGDLVEGYVQDPGKIEAQWNEFLPVVDKFDSRFFLVPGNHDVGKAEQKTFWDGKFGRRYYSFVYRDSLFLCLDSQDWDSTQPHLGEEQIAWAKDVLKKHPDVRWTFVLMHQPLWLWDSGDINRIRWIFRSKGGDETTSTGFVDIENALKGRKYSVFAGHLHVYMHQVRNGADYICLGTTGGVSVSPDNTLRGASYGEMDHFSWVTMTAGGPRVANLALDGVRAKDVHTFDQAAFVNALVFPNEPALKHGEPGRFKMGIKNMFDHDIRMGLDWPGVDSAQWEISSPSPVMTIAPGEKFEFDVKIKQVGDSAYPVVPTCSVRYAFEPGALLEKVVPLPADVDSWLSASKPVTRVSRAVAPPTMDGSLVDPVWSRVPDVPEFYEIRLERQPGEKTQAWLAWDDSKLYVAYRCEESRMSGLKADARERDGEVWADDAAEILITTDAATSNYYHFAVNPEGVFYDALRKAEKTFNSAATVAVSPHSDSWTVEMAIPWGDLGIKPSAGTKLGLLLARSRPRSSKEAFQYPPLNGSNHLIERHGLLELVK